MQFSWVASHRLFERRNIAPACGSLANPAQSGLSSKRLKLMCDATDSLDHYRRRFHKRALMRFLIVAMALVSALAIASGAFAQTTEQPTKPSPPATTPESGLDAVRGEHPEWFTEPNSYKPCPSSVVFPNGSPACLGCPVPCRWHFPRYSRER